MYFQIFFYILNNYVDSAEGSAQIDVGPENESKIATPLLWAAILHLPPASASYPLPPMIFADYCA